MKKIFLSLFILFLPFAIINFIYKNTEYGFGDNDISRFKNVPQGIQVANSGNSLGEQMNYGNFPELKSFKFSLLMQPINYDFHVLEQYASYFAKDSVFIIVLSYGEVDGILNDSIFKMIEGRYYQFLKSNYIEDFSIFNKIRHCVIPIVYAEYPFSKIKQRFFGKEIFEDEQILEESKFNCFGKKIERENFLMAFQQTIPRNGEFGFNYNYDYVLKMVRVCNSHEIHPVVITPPLPSNSIAALEQGDYFEVLERLKNSILQECENQMLDINWIDFVKAKEYLQHDEWFKDYVHLKDEYSRKYTDDIIYAIQDLGFLK